MSDRIDHFSESLRQKLTAIESMLEEAKSDLTHAGTNSAKDVRSKLQSVRHRLTAAKSDVAGAESRMTTWLKAKESSGAAVIQGWKDKHETRKLEHHAESAEASAEAGIELAEVAIVNAVIAMYEAIDARQAATLGKAA